MGAEIITPPPLSRVSLPDHAGLPIADKPLHQGEDFSPLVWLVGAHGGAGTTTLAHAIAPFGDAGQQWPAHDEYPWTVIVARTTREGIEAAHDTALQAQAGKCGDCKVLGVVLVADAPGKTPKAIEQRITVLERVVPTIWSVEYHGAWRANLLKDLPQWSPLDDEPEQIERKFWQKKQPNTDIETIPQSLRDVAEELIDRAREAHKHL
ncbi:MAG: hypothetical protein L0I87_00320 [Corynebacterium casei]|uniref:DUF6668 family protein n=1 Tax=Corynebacterium sp. TaxID=1720 RepID=UPI00264700A5|nr:DUF6668 family protein [Corynebacterium sp.]MDN6130455.1 hypothetical protein [Corynebacterium casei]MDN6154695.1 hypothetical protein [Corynebacterium casei]MDN6737486.1 hypothetical protein [Corynebacterium sp.]